MWRSFILILLLHQVWTIDIDGVSKLDRVEVAGRPISLPCTRMENLEVTSVEWRCRGCFSISDTRETIVAKLSSSKIESFVYPERMKIVGGLNGGSLNINPTSTEDSGMFFCIINSEKKPRILYNLAIQDVPSTPGKPLIMSFNSSSVNLSWAPPLHFHFAPLKHYKLEILEGETSTWTNYVTISTVNSDSNFTVTNLKPFTVYSFRVIAVNHLGSSPPSLPSYHMMTLREPPRGKPVILNTHNLSSDSIQIVWKPPESDTIHGEFLGYRISWSKQDSKDESNSIIIKEPEIQEYRLRNLQPHTQYTISLQVINPKGSGPPATVDVITDEGVPSSPLNLSVVAVTNSGFVLQWQRPEVPNGRISGYRLYYTAQLFTNVKTINSTDDVISGEVEGLDPYKKYKVFVKAFNSKNEGNSSEGIQVMTDVSGPGVPMLTNLTCPDGSSVYLEWSKPEIFYHSVDRYSVFWRRREETVWTEEKIQVPPIINKPVERILIQNFTEGSEYSIYILGYTQSLYIESLQYPGNKSEVVRIVAGRECDRVQVSPMREGVTSETSKPYLAVLLGSLVVFLALLLSVILLAVWRRTLMRKRFYVPASIGKEELQMWDIQVDKEDSSKTSVLSSVFQQHVNVLHADGDLGFHAEFQALQQLALGKDEVRQATDSKLSNFKIYNIDTFQSRNSYLYCPEPWNLDPVEFWRFVNKSSIKLLVSVDTELDNLFPREPRSYGSLDIIPILERSHPSFVVQKFQCRTKRGRRVVENEIVFLRFSSISGCRAELDFLRFVRVCSGWRKTFEKPLVLAGRSLVFLAVDSLVLQLEARNEINVPAYIRYLGECTQIDELTFRDYIFIHDVMYQAVQAKGSNISTSLITETLDPPFMEKQFSVSTELSESLLQYTAAISPKNQARNNSLEYVAADWSRVVLCPQVEGTDYINGTWIPGYSGEQEFILCQHPGLGSVSQFWHMIWQTGSKLIVCLSVIPQQFWPVVQSPLRAAGLNVWLEKECNLGGYQSAALTLENGGKTTSVQLILCPNWPHQSIPVSNCVHLVDCVNKQMSAGPTVVVDSYGATEAGIFCVLSSLVRQMDIESSIDVFYWFKSVHLSRPGVWISPDNLVFVYRVLSELCSINKK